MRKKREFGLLPRCRHVAAVHSTSCRSGCCWTVPVPCRPGRVAYSFNCCNHELSSPNHADWALQQSPPECITPQGASGSVGLLCQVWQVHVSRSKETCAFSFQPSAQLSRRSSKRHRYEHDEPSNRLIGVITQPVVVIRFGQWRRWPLPDLVRLACWEALNTWVAKRMAPSCAFLCY